MVKPEITKDVVQPTRWRMIPAFLLSIVGGMMTLVGLCFAMLSVSTLYKAWQDPDFWNYVFHETYSWTRYTLVPVLIFGWGCCWVYAGYASWSQRWKHAIVAGIVGMILCNVAFTFRSPFS